MDDFINSKPTFTPLVAGMTTTTITGTLASQFFWPANWVSIITCLILALLVTINKETPIFHTVLYYLINSVTIFTVSMGINAAGIAATTNYQKSQVNQTQTIERTVLPEGENTEPEKQTKPFFDEWF